MKTCPSY